MKKLFVLIVLLVFSFSVRGQNKSGMSLEAGAAYYYPFMGGTTKNNFNYGFSLLVSKRFRNVKVSAGIDYATKNYHYQVTPTAFDPLAKREYDMQYLDFPFLVDVTVGHFPKADIGVLSGLILNKVVGYSIVSEYNHQPPVRENGLTIPATLGLTFRLGITFSIPLSQHFALNLIPFGDVKLINNGEGADTNPHEGSYRTLPDNTFSLGFHTGVEYLF